MKTGGEKLLGKASQMLKKARRFQFTKPPKGMKIHKPPALSGRATRR